MGKKSLWLIWFGLILLFITKSIWAGIAPTYVRSVPINCSKETPVNTSFDQRFISLMETWQIPGAAVAVMKNNKTILSCGYGWANIAAHRPMQPGSLFRIGSVSKTITAMAILQLVQQNKLKLEDKIFNVLTDLKPLQSTKPDPLIYTITIRNLLQMSSGWYTDRPQDYDPLFGPWSNTMMKQFNYQIPPDCQTAARFILGTPLQFTPGTHFSYSNLNYCLLGLVINKYAKQNGYMGYESYIKQYLLAPNGIKSMQIGTTQFKEKALDEVNYYHPANNKGIFDDIDRILDGLPYSDSGILRKNYADGGWIASAPDLAKLLQAFAKGEIINAKMMAIMLEKPAYTRKSMKYPAMGWDEVDYHDGHRYLIKTGRFTGIQAVIMQYDNSTSYVVLVNVEPTNRESFNKQLQQLLWTISTENSPQKSYA